MRTTERKGLSAIDVIVVLVILMVVAALVLPAIQSTKCDNRRSDCKNKLKHLGIGLHNYHETFRTFPPGWVAVRGPMSGEHEQSAYGWNTYILPFQDSGTGLLYKKFQTSGAGDPSFQFQAANGVTFAGTVLPGFRCSNDLGESQDLTSSVPTMATTNYVANFGVGIPERQHAQLFMQGIFGENSRIRIRDIRDGTTNVVLLGERRQPRQGTYWQPGKIDGSFNSYWAGIPSGTSPLAIVGTATEGTLPQVDSAQAAARLKAIESDLLNLAGPLNGTNGPSGALRVLRINKLRDGSPLSGANEGRVSGGYSSYHRGGTQILLGDGSVRFVSDSVDVQTYINMMRRADGAVLGEF